MRPKGGCILQRLNLCAHAGALVGFSAVSLTFFICRLSITAEGGLWIPCPRVDVDIRDEAAKILGEILSYHPLDDTKLEVFVKR